MIGITNTSSALSSVIAIAIGLFVAFIILFITNPSNAVNGFIGLVSRPVSNMKQVGDVLFVATPIMMTGLSVAFAGKTGLFNIGATGQFLFGGYFAVLVGVKCPFIPGPLLCFAAIFAAFIAGAVWGSIPGLLKAFRNVNEVISCIMLNYISMFLVNYLVLNTVWNKLHNNSVAVAAHANLPKMGLGNIFKSGTLVSAVNSGIFVAVLAAVVIYIILQKTTLGYELKACGYNKDAARYAGINERRSIITAMSISGGLAGLGGALLYLSGAGIHIEVVDVLTPYGFQGIPVSLLALHNPIGVIFSSIFVAYISVGGNFMQLFGYTPQIVDIIIAVIIYFSAFALLMKGYIQRIAKKITRPSASSVEGGASDES
jgi:simple sugar transport system permease protein